MTEHGEDSFVDVEVAVGGYKSDAESDDEDYFSSSDFSDEMSQGQI